MMTTGKRNFIQVLQGADAGAGFPGQTPIDWRAPQSSTGSETSFAQRKSSLTLLRFGCLALQDSALAIWRLLGNAPVSEPRQIDRLVTAVDDRLGDRAPGRRRVHHPVPGESGDDMEVVEATRPVADHRVAVELVLLVEAGPRALHTARLERREAIRERGPD